MFDIGIALAFGKEYDSILPVAKFKFHGLGNGWQLYINRGLHIDYTYLIPITIVS